jgi:hypothetical protein
MGTSNVADLMVGKKGIPEGMQVPDQRDRMGRPVQGHKVIVHVSKGIAGTPVAMGVLVGEEAFRAAEAERSTLQSSPPATPVPAEGSGLRSIGTPETYKTTPGIVTSAQRRLL